MNLFDYDPTSEESIYAYAKQLEGMTFSDIQQRYFEYTKQVDDIHKNKKAKGQLGNLIEEYYFGYKPNSNQEADFNQVGIELKQTCIDILKNGKQSAGERLSITNISFENPVEDDFYQSHLWDKLHRILLIQYIRDKSIDRINYKIEHVNLFTPPEEDLKIIIDDYNKINEKIKAGKAHEISEGDTLYLGACTKGANAAKSLRPQYYGNHTPAKKRNFCLKRSYMDYILHEYILKDNVPYEKIIKNSNELISNTFEEIIINRINQYIGYYDYELCSIFNVEFNKNKRQWDKLSLAILGIKSNRAAEFKKANITVKTIRLEENETIKEHMSLPPISFKKLADEEWESSDLYNYFADQKFLFVIFKKHGDSYKLYKSLLWNMPISDLDNIVKEEWLKIQQTINDGVIFEITPKGRVNNNLPTASSNKIIHIRPHTNKSAYRLNNGFTKGDISKDGDQLPDGQWMTIQSFWLNNSYILKQIL